MTSNYPDGIDGTHSYFNQPDPPECPNGDCCVPLERDWEFCPGCGWHIPWSDYDFERGEWKC